MNQVSKVGFQGTVLPVEEFDFLLEDIICEFIFPKL